MNLIRIPGLLRILFPQIICNVQGEKPLLYLTFDDGPTPGISDKIMDILQQYNARATFFCIGRNVERHPEIYNRIIQSGHVTGNHTYSHLKGWYTPDGEYYHDISLAATFIQSQLYRPAYGMITPRQLKHLEKQYQIVLWDVMSYDFAYNTSSEKCFDNVLRHARAGSVIVFHDSLKASTKVLYALPRLLDHYGSLGFSFKSLPVKNLIY
jgi:peptidoglycan/xylan/chitin deacetylase (PgdA/CDA1 family)